MTDNQASPEPSRDLAAQMLAQAEENLRELRASIQQLSAQSPLKLDELQSWLTSTQPKELVRETPELKEVISAGKSAMKSFAKEQSATLAASVDALDQVHAAIAEFRSAQAVPAPPTQD